MNGELSFRGVPDHEVFPIYRPLREGGSEPKPYTGPGYVDYSKDEDPFGWMDSSLCAQIDPELFFPEKGERVKSNTAKRICSSCDVGYICTPDSLRGSLEYGVWGGQTEKQRRGHYQGQRP